MNKSQTERRKSQFAETSNSQAKIILDSKESKLQSRQQKILNIVKNTSSDKIKKLNLLTQQQVSSTESAISFNNQYKLKTSSKHKCISKIIPTPSKATISNHVISRNSHIAKETLNWVDKHYLASPFIKTVKYSKNGKIKPASSVKSEEVLQSLPSQEKDIIEIKKYDESLPIEIKEDVKESENESASQSDDSDGLSKLSQKDIILRNIQRAIRDGKIFLVRADIPYLDQVLESRGWMKKYESSKTRHLPYGKFTNLELTTSLGNIHNADNTLNEKAFVYNELKHVSPNFIWDSRNDFLQWRGDINPDTYLNRLEKSLVYTSKLGLASCLEKSYWFYEKDVSDVLYPRCYNLSEEKEAFIEDYRKTAAVSFVRWFINQVELQLEMINRNFYHTLIKPLRFALERCEEMVSVFYNENLDIEIKNIPPKDWDWFIDIYSKFVYKEGNKEVEKRKDTDHENPDIMKFYEKALKVAEAIKYFDPQYELNGVRNIWILKPNMSCCGYGIIMTHKLQNVLTKVDESTKNYFIVQKYIEKPLLVKNTKFDVRHWFLVTKSYPLTIWIYKESLLRFSSRPFTFDNYHEIIHICNTAVQRKYSDQKEPVRTLNWNCEMLNSYLRDAYPDYIGNPWYDVIYPKMCQAIISAMLAAQDRMDSRENSFELYGADFVVMEDLSVWLIEINTNPRMHPPSSQVTERLYPEVLESLIKVILDYPLDNKADTGNFVLAYEQNIDLLSKIDESLELSLEGHKISKRDIFIMDAVLDQVQMEQ